MLKQRLMFPTSSNGSSTLVYGSSRIPSAPCTRHEIIPTITEKWHNSMIPFPKKQANRIQKTAFPLDELPSGVIFEILKHLSCSNVKDPVRLGAVARNCHEAFKALSLSDKRFNETLKIFRGEYDLYGATKNSKTRHRYKIKRLGTMVQNQW